MFAIGVGMNKYITITPTEDLAVVLAVMQKKEQH